MGPVLFVKYSSKYWADEFCSDKDPFCTLPVRKFFAKIDWKSSCDVYDENDI